jgi:hypothetical protein
MDDPYKYISSKIIKMKNSTSYNCPVRDSLTKVRQKTFDALTPITSIVKKEDYDGFASHEKIRITYITKRMDPRTPIQRTLYSPTNMVAYEYLTLQGYSAAIFSGIAREPKLRNSFPSVETRTVWVESSIADFASTLKSAKADRARNLAFRHTFKVGDIFVNDLDFYKTIAVTSRKVTIRMLKSVRTFEKRGADDYESSEPVVDQFEDGPKNRCDDQTFSPRHDYLGSYPHTYSLWDGKAASRWND